MAAQGDCGQQLSGGDAPAASDCLYILRSAVGSQVCNPVCTCDVSGGGGVTASDSLLCLKVAVGQQLVLSCPCAVTTTTTSTTTTTEPPCGNGSLDQGEECDDGNRDDCDDCSHDCKIECGNDVVECDEECDDGNLEPGDGCDLCVHGCLAPFMFCSSSAQCCTGICDGAIMECSSCAPPGHSCSELACCVGDCIGGECFFNPE